MQAFEKAAWTASPRHLMFAGSEDADDFKVAGSTSVENASATQAREDPP